ncbi:hypothetical protein PAXINDRAFT_21139 [Paxillus involutus ATCC 200175]|uniref:Uncharacterized protein n=1 Tax=Paxillus involutus ATCC 200175 TaxID=664439 RepID=A0A0C9T276_PAXIN|nr:hypothetical protein PAXINDRAFT_21139 [Paxillus involutus ATCC 200175]
MDIVNSIAVSQNDKFTGPWDKTVRLRDTATRQQIGPALQHNDDINYVTIDDKDEKVANRDNKFTRKKGQGAETQTQPERQQAGGGVEAERPVDLPNPKPVASLTVTTNTKFAIEAIESGKQSCAAVTGLVRQRMIVWK